MNLDICASIKCVLLILSIQSAHAFVPEKDDADILGLSLEQLLKLKVSTASKTEQSISDAPSIISVITADELKELGVKTLAEALLTTPGITFVEQEKGDQVMVVRGIGLKDGVLVLFDGAPVNDAFDGSFGFYSRPIDDIHRIEILRGPSSALYGSYAVSGVVHIFTKSWADSKEWLKLQASGGSFSNRSFSFNYVPDVDFVSPDLKISTSFTYLDEKGDDYFIAQDSIFTPEQGTFLPPFSNPTLTPTTRGKSMEKFNGHLNANYNGVKLTLIHSQEITNPIVSHLGIVTAVDQTIKETTQDLMSINYQLDMDDELSYLFNAFYIRNESKLFGQSEPPQIHGDEDQDGLNENFFSGIIENFHHQTRSFGFDVAIKYQLNNQHQLLFGFSQNHTKLIEASKFANVSLAGRGPTEIFPVQDITDEFISPGLKRKENAFYIQDNWAYSESTNITLGARFGDYSDFGSTSDPRLGINYRISPKFYTKVLYGEAFKAPAFSQLFDATPTLSANRQRGNAELEPTEIETFEWQVGYDISDKLNSSITLFNNKTENEIFFDPTPGIEQWNNSGERESNGIELELKGAFLGFDIASLNYSYQSTSGVDMGAGADIHPPHRLNFNGVQTLTDNVNWSISYAFYSSPNREAGDDRERVASRSMLNLSLRRENLFIPELSIELSAKNLLDDDGRYETEAALGLLNDIPIEGRRINLTAEYVFQ